MSDGHRVTDDIAFYAADIGDTIVLAASAAGAQTPDVGAAGALPPGRYLVQARNLSVATAVVWVHVGSWVTAVPIVLTVGAGRRRVPLSAEVPAIEFHVRKNDSDRIGAITSSGTADVWITRISAGA